MMPASPSTCAIQCMIMNVAPVHSACTMVGLLNCRSTVNAFQSRLVY